MIAFYEGTDIWDLSKNGFTNIHTSRFQFKIDRSKPKKKPRKKECKIASPIKDKKEYVKFSKARFSLQ